MGATRIVEGRETTAGLLTAAPTRIIRDGSDAIEDASNPSGSALVYKGTLSLESEDE